MHPTRHDRVLVVNLSHRQGALPPEGVDEDSVGGLDAAVLGDRDRGAEVARQTREHEPEGGEPSPRRTHHDQLVAHRTRR